MTGGGDFRCAARDVRSATQEKLRALRTERIAKLRAARGARGGPAAATVVPGPPPASGGEAPRGDLAVSAGAARLIETAALAPPAGAPANVARSPSEEMDPFPAPDATPGAAHGAEGRGGVALAEDFAATSDPEPADVADTADAPIKLAGDAPAGSEGAPAQAPTAAENVRSARGEGGHGTPDTARAPDPRDAAPTHGAVPVLAGNGGAAPEPGDGATRADAARRESAEGMRSANPAPCATRTRAASPEPMAGPKAGEAEADTGADQGRVAAAAGPDPGERTLPQGAQASLGSAEATGHPGGSAAASDLAQLPGAGPGLVWLLERHGVATLADLARADAGALRSELGTVGQILDIDRWIAFAVDAGR